ncbi:hypothetical protein JMJ77_0002834 [Colletotrichum scovillei]|uniref:Uncharacterized protein n=1 Tax=Colletotrichum scovillei TaxID=1209932 RepID=A0A9P7U7G0_9PEZI|nr:hypothetical protein JMJ78_0006047 [Colletotrichum scovillei]KAG7043123.1 hypothetical protein JMJ77_0002834 [Colletotrichum scovillei]KAG7062571.1 hypothetical protein JMJ76_0009419 [Colletotrichum scovillei]
MTPSPLDCRRPSPLQHPQCPIPSPRSISFPRQQCLTLKPTWKSEDDLYPRTQTLSAILSASKRGHFNFQSSSHICKQPHSPGSQGIVAIYASRGAKMFGRLVSWE